MNPNIDANQVVSVLRDVYQQALEKHGLNGSEEFPRELVADYRSPDEWESIWTEIPTASVHGVVREAECRPEPDGAEKSIERELLSFRCDVLGERLIITRREMVLCIMPRPEDEKSPEWETTRVSDWIYSSKYKGWVDVGTWNVPLYEPAKHDIIPASENQIRVFESMFSDPRIQSMPTGLQGPSGVRVRAALPKALRCAGLFEELSRFGQVLVFEDRTDSAPRKVELKQDDQLDALRQSRKIAFLYKKLFGGIRWKTHPVEVLLVLARRPCQRMITSSELLVTEFSVDLAQDRVVSLPTYPYWCALNTRYRPHDYHSAIDCAEIEEGELSGETVTRFREVCARFGSIELTRS